MNGLQQPRTTTRLSSHTGDKGGVTCVGICAACFIDVFLTRCNAVAPNTLRIHLPHQRSSNAASPTRSTERNSTHSTR